MDNQLRRAVLCRAAVEIVRLNGFEHLTHRAVADQCGVSARTVYRWAGNIKGLRRKTINYARACGALDVVDRAVLLRIR